ITDPPVLIGLVWLHRLNGITTIMIIDLISHAVSLETISSNIPSQKMKAPVAHSTLMKSLYKPPVFLPGVI
ncbi:MAG: hypothetical protein ACFFDN_48170, partial [Candidatus Hodarchaeota archaeon]